MPKGRRSRTAGALAEAPLKTFLDPKLVNAIAHPARAHVLATLNERIASPSEVAEEVGLDVKYLNYHFEELERSGCIELIRTERCRGATKHFYRAKETMMFGNEEWLELPESLRSTLCQQWMGGLFAEAKEALAAGSFEARPDRHFSWTPLCVDEQGWREAVEILDEALDRILERAAESAARLAEGDGEAIPMTVGIAGFENASRAPGKRPSSGSG